MIRDGFESVLCEISLGCPHSVLAMIEAFRLDLAMIHPCARKITGLVETGFKIWM